jgi:hypothetical protein
MQRVEVLGIYISTTSSNGINSSNNSIRSSNSDHFNSFMFLPKSPK